MRKFPVLLIVSAYLFTQPVYVQSQSFYSSYNDSDAYSVLDAYYLGRTVAANILSYYKPYTGNPEATRYLNNICQALAINSSRPPAYNGYHVMILDSNEINAFASPGGHIFITKKLIEITTSEDMLAAVIAHELSHVMLRHSIAIIEDTKFEREMSSLADWAAGAAAKNSEKAVQFTAFRGSVTKIVDTLLINGYSQQQEFDADREAITLLLKTGYNPSALMDMLKILQQIQGFQRIGLFSTHPAPALRIANIQGLLYKTTNTTQYRTERFKALKW